MSRHITVIVTDDEGTVLDKEDMEIESFVSILDVKGRNNTNDLHSAEELELFVGHEYE